MKNLVMFLGKILFYLFKKSTYYSVYGLTHLLELALEKADRMILIRGRPKTEDANSIYLIRYYLFPESFPWQVYVHRFLRSDHDVPHDHPFDFIGVVLKGGYEEEILRESRWLPGINNLSRSWNPPGTFLIRAASHKHRVIINRKYKYSERRKAPLTLILRSPRYQEWGFWKVTPGGRGWVQWETYLGLDAKTTPKEAQ